MSNDPSFADLVRQAMHDQTTEQTTTPPTLSELLAQVAETGQALTDQQISSIRFHRGDAEQRAHARHRIGYYSRKIAAMIRDGRHTEAQDIIDEAISGYGHLVDREPPARDELPPRRTGTTERARAERKDTTVLRELLEAATAGVLPRDKDLVRLPVRDGAGKQEISEWHANIRATATEIAEIHRSGEQQRARLLARSSADELGELLAGPDEQEDDTDDLSPRELASRIPRSA